MAYGVEGLGEESDQIHGAGYLEVDLPGQHDGQEDVARCGLTVRGQVDDEQDRRDVAEGEHAPAGRGDEPGSGLGRDLNAGQVFERGAFATSELCTEIEHAQFLGGGRRREQRPEVFASSGKRGPGELRALVDALGSFAGGQRRKCEERQRDQRRVHGCQ